MLNLSKWREKKESAVLVASWRAEHRRPDGSLIEVLTIKPNKIVDVGILDMLGVYFVSGTQTLTANWFPGLTGHDPVVAATDTMLSHPGWNVEDRVQEATWLSWNPGAPAGNSVTNPTAVTYTFSASGVPVGGLYLNNSSDKASTTSLLFSAGAFTEGNRTGNTNETIGLFLQIDLASTT